MQVIPSPEIGSLGVRTLRLLRPISVMQVHTCEPPGELVGNPAEQQVHFPRPSTKRAADTALDTAIQLIQVRATIYSTYCRSFLSLTKSKINNIS